MKDKILELLLSTDGYLSGKRSVNASASPGPPYGSGWISSGGKMAWSWSPIPARVIS